MARDPTTGEKSSHPRYAPSRNDDHKKRDSTRTIQSEAKKRSRETKHVRRTTVLDEEEEEEDQNAVSNSGKIGGIYIPPFKLNRMMKAKETITIQDKGSVEYQKLNWEALRKSITGVLNRLTSTNIKHLIPELFAKNLIRGKDIFCRCCIKSQMAFPSFTHVFTALISVVNSKFPQVCEPLLKNVVLQFKIAYKHNDKPRSLSAVKFIAHLVNQRVVHEEIAVELIDVLLENPTDDCVEVAIRFVTECGSLLQYLSSKVLDGAFERFRGVLHKGEICNRVQFFLEGLFAIRKAKFQGYPAVLLELDLVEEADQFTHKISLLEDIDPEITLDDLFKPDDNFLENEKKYEELWKSIFDREEDEDEEEQQMEVKDAIDPNLIKLRKTIHLTIMSNVDFEMAVHKLLKVKLEPGQEMELCIVVLECCSQERTYLRYYGLLGERLCMINKVYQENFEKCFVEQYSMVHQLETNKLRRLAKFFAHLLAIDALHWRVLVNIRVTEEDTSPSSRIFIKILFQELSEHLGICKLNKRLADPTMQDSYESIFPRDNPKNARFSINFFTALGLGGITENLREYLKNMPRVIVHPQKPLSDSSSSSDYDSSSSGDHEKRRKPRGRDDKRRRRD